MVSHKCPYNFGTYTMNKIVHIHIQVHPKFDDIIITSYHLWQMVICDLSKATKGILLIIVISLLGNMGLFH